MSNKHASSVLSESYLWTLIICVVVIWLAYWKWIQWYVPNDLGPVDAQAYRGQFGDMFGAINALFSALAFAVLVYTVWLQNREIGEQMRSQNQSMKAQLVRDQFELYWRAYDPVSCDHILDFQSYPEGYMKRDLFDRKYNANDALIRKYIHVSKVYEILAFSYERNLAELDNTANPLGQAWIDAYVDSFRGDGVFLDVHKQYTGFYKPFEDYIDLKFGLKTVTQSAESKS